MPTLSILKYFLYLRREREGEREKGLTSTLHDHAQSRVHQHLDALWRHADAILPGVTLLENSHGQPRVGDGRPQYLEGWVGGGELVERLLQLGDSLIVIGGQE